MRRISNIRAPRVVVAGIESGVGKTTIAAGLMAALKRRGLKVQGFKVGPDFIDPSYHMAATGRPSRNLDTWLLSKSRVVSLFKHVMLDADVAVIEGVMGLFDGLSGRSHTASTAEIARLLKAPVLLVVDVSRMAGSAAAVVRGAKSLGKGLSIEGVILNKVAGEKHAKWCSEAIKRFTKTRIVGALPYNPDIALPERHLGLIPTHEREEIQEKLDAIALFIEEHINLDAVLEIAKGAPRLSSMARIRKERIVDDEGRPCIAVAYDEAFNFYYWDSLMLLEELGARLIFFSPIHDNILPKDTAFIYMGGGFPESFAKQLSENWSMINALKKAVEDEMPIYCECGGLMYLTRTIIDFDDNKYRMVGVLDADTRMTRQLTLNYTLANTIRDNLVSEIDEKIRGHEFHFSVIEDVPRDARFAYKMIHGRGIVNGMDGWMIHQTQAQYTHLHLAANRKRAEKILAAAKKYTSR
ncbi:MAG: cobyrinate a,c-diamide synthase [Aigarchaeota archaeon]|nr:cobyrinate a,c-diamide synthase [Candidatus Pelearchaeum maunauluense]